MYCRALLLTAALLLLAGNAPGAEKSLTGTWCLEEEELMITFTGKDSVRVHSVAEDGVNGTGSFRRQDTMFVATIAADSLEVKMGYRYSWNSDSLITARTLFMTVNGDSINVTGEDVQMKRCAAPEEKKAAPATDTGRKSRK